MNNSRSLFDVIGPIMVGPSSSHTAGAVRLGALARAIYGGQPDRVRISLHGSFAATGDGHGTKLALIAGLLGWTCDDLRIPDAFSFAKEQGLDFSFEEIALDEVHPNTAVFELEAVGKMPMRIVGSSIGGGDVVITNIDDYAVEATGALPLVMVAHQDLPGVICAVSGIMSAHGINIASMRVSREQRGAKALMLIELDNLPDSTIVDELEALEHVRHARVLPAV